MARYSPAQAYWRIRQNRERQNAILGALSDPIAARFDAAGMPLRSDAKAALRTFVNRLQADGIWAKRDVICIPALMDASADPLNIRQNAYNPTRVGTPAFTARKGFSCSTGNYIRSNFTPGGGGQLLAQDNHNLAVYSLNDADANAVLGGGNFAITPMTAANETRARSAFSTPTNTVATGVMSGVGLHAINRTGAASYDYRKNGAFVSTFTQASVGVGTTEFWIGGTNPGAASARLVPYVAWGSSLTVAQQAAEYAALTELLQMIGAFSA